MKSIKQLLSLSFFAALMLITVVSCSPEEATPGEIAMTDEHPKSITRATKKKVASKAYYFKSLATFAHGQAEMELTDVASLQGKQVNLMVLYESIAPWAANFASGDYSKTGDDVLNGLIESYGMTITQQFVIDENNEGFVLESDATLENPIDVAKELSMVNHVLMVHVKEVPQENVEEISAKTPNQ